MALRRLPVCLPKWHEVVGRKPDMKRSISWLTVVFPLPSDPTIAMIGAFRPGILEK